MFNFISKIIYFFRKTKFGLNKFSHVHNYFYGFLNKHCSEAVFSSEAVFIVFSSEAVFIVFRKNIVQKHRHIQQWDLFWTNLKLINLSPYENVWPLSGPKLDHKQFEKLQYIKERGQPITFSTHNMTFATDKNMKVKNFCCFLSFNTIYFKPYFELIAVAEA